MATTFRNIEAERARLGLTREQFAERLGMTRASYRNKVTGITDFTVSEIRTLVTMTGQTADYLLEAYDEEFND